MSTPSASAADSAVELNYPGGDLKLPILPAAEGSAGIQLGRLLSETGLVTLDPGFVNTAVVHVGDHLHRRRRRASCATAATRSSSSPSARPSSRSAYLLIYGELPTPEQLADFSADRSASTPCCTRTSSASSTAFPRDAHPMPVLSSAVTALSTFYQDSLDPFDAEHVELSTDPAAGQAADDRGVRLQEVGRPAVRSTRTTPSGWCENFLRMTFGLPAEPYEVDPAWCTRWTCCSSCTPTTSRTARPRPCGWSAPRRPTCSPRSRPASTPCPARCTAARTRPCWRCSTSIQRRRRRRRRLRQRVKNKEHGVRLMGFGHRVYKNYDPRATIVKRPADDVLSRAGRRDALLDIAHGARGARARPTTTSSSASSTRTWTSTPA